MAPPPERRTWRDLVAVAVITLALILTVAAVLATGSAARSDLRAADEPQPTYGPAAGVPTALSPLWSHPSAGSGAPLVTTGNLVTVHDDTLVGRDAGTGEVRWSYSHAGTPCAATFFADRLVAAFHGAAGCSDVTAIDPTTQDYLATRQSAFADTMEMRSTWAHVLAMGPDRVEIWRDDLVRTVEYGAVEAPQEAGMQPRSGCTILGGDLTDLRFAVTERCPGEDTVRLTVSATVPADNRQPEEIDSAPTDADGLWIIDVTDTAVLAVRERGAEWTVERYTSPTEHTRVLTLPGAPARTPSADTVAGDDGQVRWFDGAATHAFRVGSGEHAWTADGTTGPGLTGGHDPTPTTTTGGEWVLVPTADGFSVLDHGTGDHRHDPAVERRDDGDDRVPDEDEVVGLAQVGDILYERRGGAVYAYKMIAD